MAKPPLPFAVQVNPWAAVTALVLLAWLDSIFGSFIAIAAVGLLLGSLVLHELGHVIVAAINNVPVTGIGISLLGTFIRRHRAASPWVESAISLAGPVTSLALAALFALGRAHLYVWLAEMNLVLAISNLIPIAGTDGSRALNAIWIASGVKR